MNTKLISITPESEKIIAYCARVSNPANQDNPEVAKLLSYCIKHGHWSIFEMANMCVEITTSRAIAAQILRHKSFSFQEFSQRYAEVGEPPEAVIYQARRQDLKNRQNSIDDMSEDDKIWFKNAQEDVAEFAYQRYKLALRKGIAKEQARFLLPLSTETKLYMNGSVRSWIHYLQLRTDKATQLEHREIAEGIKAIFCEQLPTIAKALDWKEE